MKHIMITGFILISILFLIGCAQNNDSERETETNTAPTEVGEVIDETKIQDEIQYLDDGTPYLLHPSNVLSGGPPKDGIPSLDEPEFESAEDADTWLQPNDLVLGLNYNGVIRAYPHRILNWHEIVNDFAGDERVLVTYCPLCRTGIAFKPIVDSEEVEFGTSGKLYNSELVMYDRKTDSYWPQTLGKAVIGEATGQVLEKIPLDTVRWVDWKTTYPGTEVLTRETGFIRDYERNPYASIQGSDQVGFGVEFSDTRLPPKEIVYGVEIDGKTKAYSEDKVKEEIVINDAVGGTPIVVIWDTRLNVAKIFERTHNDETLQFSIEGIEIKDNKGVVWTVAQMQDELEIVDTFGHFWFSWAAFFPETEVY